MDIIAFIREVHRQIDDKLNEKTRRLLMAAEANAIGRGGISLVAKANKASRITIKNGQEELAGHKAPAVARVRRDGGGRKKMVDQQEALWLRLSELLNPHNLTDSPCVLHWTDKSLRHLSIDLKKVGYNVSHVTLGRILEDAGFALQANRKTVEKMQPEERIAQFDEINHLSNRFLNLGYPVIVVSLRKNSHENNGLDILENNTSTDAAKIMLRDDEDADPETTLAKDSTGSTHENGWESMGIFRDTAPFAASSIKSWWINMGCKKFAGAKKILIIADGGGADGAKSRAWRSELKKLGQILPLEIHVSHFPPGTTRWRSIEHFLLTRLIRHWNNKTIESLEVRVHLISDKIEPLIIKLKSQGTKSVNKSVPESTQSKYKSSACMGRDIPSRWNYIITQNIE